MSLPSLGLTLYGLRQRPEAGRARPSPDRPAGRLAWLHVAGPDSAAPMEELGRRLIEDDGLALLITGATALPPEGALQDQPPAETAAGVRAFLDHWRPDVAVFSGGELRPTLAREARARRLPLILADATRPRLHGGLDNWIPGLMRQALAAYPLIAARDEAAAIAFRKAGALPSAVRVTGRMEERSLAPACPEAERAALAQVLATRPVWLAAAVPEAEEAAILAAHRAVLGQAHRLLLILNPAEAERAQPLADRLAEEGWPVALRSAEEDPLPDTEVFIVDGSAELGLWYRLAPITFLGGSLSGAGAGRSPIEPAALGSAILHGPRTGVHGALLGRLGAARATRAVASSADLAEALGDLLAPDRAARLAQAAWAVASEGAEATDAVLAGIRALADGGP